MREGVEQEEMKEEDLEEEGDVEEDEEELLEEEQLVVKEGRKNLDRGRGGSFLNIGAITPLGAAPASFAQQCPA